MVKCRQQVPAWLRSADFRAFVQPSTEISKGLGLSGASCEAREGMSSEE